MNRTKRVQLKLKPKVRQFGFTQKVFKSIAAHIADNLDLEDDAADEDVDKAIDKAIEDAAPYFAFIQSQAGALHDEWKKNNKDEEEDEDEEPIPSESTNRNRPKKSVKPQKEEETPAWAKSFVTTVESLKSEIESIKGENIKTSRRRKLETLLKDSGAFGKMQLKNFSRASFKDDDDFEEYYSDVEADLKAYRQELADKGLSDMGTPPGNKGRKSNTQTEVFSDEEIEALAN